MPDNDGVDDDDGVAVGLVELDGDGVKDVVPDGDWEELGVEVVDAEADTLVV